jgi:hypothetical protein
MNLHANLKKLQEIEQKVDQNEETREAYIFWIITMFRIVGFVFLYRLAVCWFIDGFGFEWEYKRHSGY